MIIITSGQQWVDVDALACAVAYKELLSLQEIDSKIVFPGDLNHSVSEMVTKYSFEIEKELPQDITGFVIMDVSDPEHIASFVKPNKVLSIFDHHYGFLEYWNEMIGKENVTIEMIGACTTLVWEEFKKLGFAEKISTQTASLLAIGTISNTLNLKVSLTSQRDINCYNELLPISDLNEDWKEVYFQEQEIELFKKPLETIKNDTKIQEISNLDISLVIGQIELWDAENFLTNYIDDIRTSLMQYNNPHWMMTIPSISEGKNYIYTESDHVKKILNKSLGWDFKENLCITNNLILRKEILKSLYQLDLQ